jgi:signal transduction histidine kinase
LVILAAQAGVAVENANLYEEARQRERRLEAVQEIATNILEGAEPEAALPLVARRARELVGATVAMLTVPGGESGSLVIQVADGAHADLLLGLQLPVDGSVSGEVIRTGRPAILEDASADEKAYQPMVSAGEMGPAMFLPLAVRGVAFGTLAVANPPGGRTFTDDDLALLETFASQASVAIEYGRAQTELNRLTVMEERERIAKELHDGVIQSLFAVGMSLQAAATVSRDPDLERRVSDAVSEIDHAIRDLRNYIFGLRPGILADRQLDQALRRMAADFQERSGVTTAVDIDPAAAAELSPRAGEVVQLVREALSNVGRHAAADTCRLSLRRDGRGAILEIDDDGRGFDTAAAVGTGLGLTNLRERAAAIDGELDIQSRLGEGTTVVISLPL